METTILVTFYMLYAKVVDILANINATAEFHSHVRIHFYQPKKAFEAYQRMLKEQDKENNNG